MASISARCLPSHAQANFPGAKSITGTVCRAKAWKFRTFSIAAKWKKDIYQDFQGYAKPVRLLPATEAKICTDNSSDRSETFSFEDHEILYKLRLQTSKIYGSDLTDPNSGVLVCFIGESGSSVLQRLPAAVSENVEIHGDLHFQRGSVDEFAFKGPDLGRITAVWIGLESGMWRIGGMNLKTLSHVPREDSSAENFPSSLCYHFEMEDILLGEKSETSMIECRPDSITEISQDTFTLLYENTSNASNEESMKEYADLKFSLLLYDAVLVLGGASVLSFSDRNDALFAFLAGGLFGFFYLFLLQRSVDGLNVQKFMHGDKKENFIQVPESLRVAVAGFALASTIAIITMKYAPAVDVLGVKMSPERIIFGMMGFLMCKVAVLLAAFKPLQISIKDCNQGP